MKRSQINAALVDAITFIEQHRFAVPPFAFWTPKDWLRKGDTSSLIVQPGQITPMHHHITKTDHTSTAAAVVSSLGRSDPGLTGRQMPDQPL
jgi:D-lyxose ketol-isomerase